MTGRLASRAADVEALLARFNDASEAAIRALDRGDVDALARALDVRDELQHEIERASRDVETTRTRFAAASHAYGRSRVVDQAVDRYCAPLEELARVAQRLQHRLEITAGQSRERLLGELARLETGADAAARYASSAIGELHLPDASRFDVTL
jgi:hypothetical protein